MKLPESEIQKVRDMFQDAVFQIETEGHSVGSFASAALLAASEVYSEVHGSAALGKAFASISKAEMIHSGTAGRA